MSACATTSPSECPARPRGCSIGHASEHERHARLERVRVESDSDPKLGHASEANASGSDARSSRPSAASGGVRLQTPPRPASNVDCEPVPRQRQEERRCRRGRPRTRPPPRCSPISSATLAKNAGSGLRTPRLADDEMTSAGKSRLARPRLERLGLVADDPGAEAELTSRARRQSSASGYRSSSEYGTPVPARRPVDPEMAPERRRAPPPARSSHPARPRRHAAATRAAPPRRRHHRSSSTSVSPTSNTTPLRATTRRARDRRTS